MVLVMKPGMGHPFLDSGVKREERMGASVRDKEVVIRISIRVVCFLGMVSVAADTLIKMSCLRWGVG